MKRGPKPKELDGSSECDKKLLELFNKGGITFSHAAELAGVTRQYASEKFKVFGNEIQEQNALKGETWIETNTRVRDRSLEALSRQINDADEKISDTEKRLRVAKDTMDEILPETANKLAESELGMALENIDRKTIFAIFKLISNDLNMWKNYGYYVEQINSNLRAERTFKAELQMQYDTITIMPPAEEIINAEIEKRIAERNNLAEKSKQEQVIEAGKKK